MLCKFLDLKSTKVTCPWWTRNAFVQGNAICTSNAFIIVKIFISYGFYVISDRKSCGNGLILLKVDMSPLCSKQSLYLLSYLSHFHQALTSLICADVPLRNYSLTQPRTWLRGCKNRPEPFSGEMLYKATKPWFYWFMFVVDVASFCVFFMFQAHVVLYFFVFSY